MKEYSSYTTADFLNDDLFFSGIIPEKEIIIEKSLPIVPIVSRI